jgi:dihydropteroate synthase
MEPLLRIAGHGALTLTFTGLTQQQAAALQHGTGIPNDGADRGSAPSCCLEAGSGQGCGAVWTGTAAQLRRQAALLSSFPALPPDLSRKVESALDNYLRSDYKITSKGVCLDLGRRSHIMGILNVTPDSFSDGGRYIDPDRALAHARDMAAAGADIIDIGGESTRPGADPLPEEEELRRILPLIERLSAELTVPISVDTYKSSVAKKALEAGASIVNDISGLRFSPDMAAVVAEYGAAVVIMHIKGTPRDMQQHPVYTDVVGEIRMFLEEGIEIAVRAGVNRERILVDPGIGFGKTLDHNLTILNRLDEFRVLGRPIVLGTSRKRFIGTVLSIPVADQRMEGTAATVALGIERGASVLRVHDVAVMARVARMSDAIVRNKL